MSRDTHVFAALSSCAILISIFACSDPSDTSVQGSIGEEGIPVEEWEMAPVSMATGTSYELRSSTSHIFQSATPDDSRVTTVIENESKQIAITAPNEPLETSIELALASADDQGIATLELSVKDPDQFELLHNEEPDAPLSETLLFLEDDFTLGYELYESGELLVGHGFMPYEPSVEGASVTSVRENLVLGPLRFYPRRALEFQVEAETERVELTAAREGFSNLTLERVPAERVDGIRWINTLPQLMEGESEADRPCCEPIGEEEILSFGEEEQWFSVSLRATSGAEVVHGTTFSVVSKNPDVCQVSQGIGNNLEQDESQPDVVLLRDGLREQVMIMDSRESLGESAECLLEATLVANPDVTSTIAITIPAAQTNE